MLVPAGTQRWPGQTWSWRARYDCGLGGRRWRGRGGEACKEEEKEEEVRKWRSGGKGGEEVASGSV